MSRLSEIRSPYALLTLLRKLVKLAFSPYLALVFKHPKLGRGLSRGRYRSFEEAEAAHPRAPMGYDNEKMQRYYRAGLRPDDRALQARDYPVLHHLGRLLKPGGRVFDLGGNVGNHYYLYRHHLPLGEVSWTVGEVKAIAAIGAAIAAEQGAKNLAFTSELAGMGGHDVLVCQGSIQYFKAFPPEDAKAFPPALLVNRQPLTRGSTFVTMQNGGEGIFYPQRIYNQDEFRALLKSLGYRIVDEWPDPDDEIMLPFHRRAVEYRGCYAARD